MSLNWFHVTFDEHGFTRRAQPLGAEAWADTVRWDEIERVCLQMEGLFGSDALYVFARGREASYAVPMEAEGAHELLDELIRRKLFEAELAITAASSEGPVGWPGD
jgi:hypothetical protein